LIMKLQQYVTKGSFYKAVVEDGSDVIFVVDFEGNICYHNNSVLETLGYKAKSLIGKNFFDFILPETLDNLKIRFKQSQKRAYTEKVEFQFLCANQSYRFLEFNAINLKHKEGLEGFILDCRDITQRKYDSEEMVRLQKAKEQFLANISHEIRTPINGIAGMADLLGQNASLEDRETYLNAIKHSSENLKVIINDILDLAAIESGKLRFEKIAFNLTDLVPSLIGTFAYQAKEKKLKLDYLIDEKLNRILLGDPVRLNQVLINLISNAVKFTHSGAIQINCSIERQQKDTCWVRIEVSDTGIGIPSEKLNTIFESFSQADESVTRKYGGSGLGLTIVKQLVELQLGKITVRSEEHRGSTFIVLIPYSIGKEASLRSTLAAKSLSINSEINQLSVLLVEDNDINRLYAKSILKNWHCEVDIAENGLVAIEKVKNNSYDIILMDIQMPVMDGYEATKAIRLMHSPKNEVPIIALTANATKTDVEKCLASGMNDYLPKPFTPDDLHRKIVDDLKITPSQQPSQKKSSASTKQNTFDFTYLRTISNNNEEFIKEMIQTFLQTIPGTLNEMRNCLQQKDWEKLARFAHQIKPSFTLMGIDELRPVVVSIEENGKNKTNLDELPRVTTEFIKSCEALLDDFTKKLASF
jgi:PAS domain S-box-containing protein